MDFRRQSRKSGMDGDDLKCLFDLKQLRKRRHFGGPEIAVDPRCQFTARGSSSGLLSRSSGGVIFTTIQKFLPEKGSKAAPLSDRRNVVVIADEAHRSQYGFIQGFARHMRDTLPNASFIGFTATPIETDDRSTPSVFGNYIDKYDIQRAVEDGATVSIYYEDRVFRLARAPYAGPWPCRSGFE